MESLFDIGGKVAVVTGGAGTLGSSISEALTRHGARVVILGRDPVNVKQQAEKLTVMGANPWPWWPT